MANRTLRTLRDSIKFIVNAAAGGAFLAAIIGGIWALISAFGALVVHATTWAEGKPGMWSISSMFAIVDGPPSVSVKVGFLLLLLIAVTGVSLLVAAGVSLLASLGELVLSVVQKEESS